jgi:bacillopeptidase F (M6 metalloprotease family)
LTYWTAWDIENRYDGGVVEISINGGSTWSTLTPTGGYPGTFRLSADACGYPNNQPAYTGTGSLTFASYSVDLSAYDGQTVIIRWNFSTDGYLTEEGWYVDEISITHAQVEGACEPTPSDVSHLTARATSDQVKLEWMNPSDTFASTRICRDDAASPTDPETC